MPITSQQTHLSPTINPTATRRQFLKLSGAMAGWVMAGIGLDRPITHAAATTTEASFGVLLPSLAQSHTTGLLWLRELQRALPAQLRAILPEPTASLTQAADALLAQDVRVVAGLIDTEYAHQIAPAWAAQPIDFIQAGFGARAAFDANETVGLGNVSLYQWQANWAFGRWQAQNLGRRGVMVMSMHEGGYDSPYAFQSGFESAGGEIVASLVVDAPIAPLSWPDTVARIRAAQPDVVYALLRDSAAQQFLVAVQSAGLWGRIAFSGSPYVLTAALHHLGAAATGLRSWRTWHNPAKPPITALAHATAQRILSSATPQNPSIYVSQIGLYRGQAHINSVAHLGPVRAVQPLTFTGLRSGWLNPYL